MKDYIVTRKAIVLKMEKPLFGSKYYIRNKYIKLSKRRNLAIVLETPDGKATYTAKGWLKDADRMEKVFNFPDRPMILWGKHIKMDVEKRTERKKQEKNPPKIDFDVKVKLAQRIIKKNPRLAKQLNLTT